MNAKDQRQDKSASLGRQTPGPQGCSEAGLRLKKVA